uniref:Calcium-transporting ATPase n=1 Tax=Tetradesmus obliquus TaxID=3088 RepID=A0A383WGV1_TETOB|eukprot:jgi/Sobl393_1/10021/SZX76442.1
MGSSPYGVEPAELFAINSEKDSEALNGKLGGVAGLAAKLNSDIKAGLTAEAADASRQHFGANTYRQVPPKSFFRILAEGFKDPVILLLCAAALLSTVLGAAIPEERHEGKWIEGVAIWVAIFLVTFVSAINDFQKDLQFRKLNAQKDVIEVKVLRGGDTRLVRNSDVVVGDLLLLDTGDKIIADGLVVDSYGLVVDEASLTGESDPIKKHAEDPWCRSGTQVSEGSGKMLVTAVGDASEWGKTISLVTSSGDEQTPLQEKLGHVAATVGKIGGSVAATCFVALLIKWCVINRGFPLSKINDNGPVQFFLYSVTIIVVAIPEGLPLAVTMALAYSMKKMMKDQNFVRVLAACETMGGATAICSDKTGTLTENRMTVTEGWFAGVKLDHAPNPEEVPGEVRSLLELNFALNSKAFLIEHSKDLVDFVGNRTECALLMLSRKWGSDYKALRDTHQPKIEQRLGKALRDTHQPKIEQMYQFTSAKKMASVLLRTSPDSLLLLNKGAAEWVLAKCSSIAVTDSSGKMSSQPLDDASRAQLMDTVVGMASRGLRCICLASRELPAEDAARAVNFFEDSANLDVNMTALAVVGIKDPVRAEVPAAVATCQKAGIVVRMVTGDNIHTARHIARECGILSQDGIALEGPDFRNMPIHDLLPLLPKLQVLARSSPEDKLTLVSLLKHHGEVVAVTGDGTNDAPALKESDVGLAMGIAGTEVAKEAADIVILDDNFSSIVKSVLWGRSVFTSIRKFLQFQLTVNFVALIVSFVGAMVGGRMPLNVLQLLWVNLIMDTMGALALATETPSPKLLDEKPAGRSEPLINGKMFKHILLQGFYQLFWMFLFLYGLPTLVPQRYAFTTPCQLYTPDFCTNSVAIQQLGMAPADAARYCSYVSSCSLPCSSSSSGVCPLGDAAAAAADPAAAICKGQAGCSDYDTFKGLQSALERRLHQQQDKDFLRVASVLFNTFIFAQIFNLVVSRRINDEYNFFEGLHKSTLFLVILAIIVFCQTMIINFLGFFFKVQPLTWQEWLFTIAIGAGAMLWSTAVRFLSRNVSCGQVSIFTAIGNRLARMNQVTSKQMAASHAVYDGPGSLQMTVHDAVALARGKAAAAESAEAEAEKAAEGKKGGGWLKGKGKTTQQNERTISGRSDSAASLN